MHGWTDGRTNGWILTVIGFTPGGSVKVQYLQTHIHNKKEENKTINNNEQYNNTEEYSNTEKEYLPWRVKAAGAYSWQPYHLHVPNVWNWTSWSPRGLLWRVPLLPELPLVIYFSSYLLSLFFFLFCTPIEIIHFSHRRYEGLGRHYIVIM